MSLSSSDLFNGREKGLLFAAWLGVLARDKNKQNLVRNTLPLGLFRQLLVSKLASPLFCVGSWS